MPFVSSREMRVSLSSSPSPTPLRSRTRVTKNLAVLKRVTTRTNSGWPSKGWQARSGWQHSLVDDGGQSSQDQWKRPASHGKWKEFFNVVEELGTLLKDKKGTWVETFQRKYGKRNRSPCRDRRIQKLQEKLM